MIKMSKLIKQQNDMIRKETGMVKEEKIPADIKRFMDRFIDKLKDKNLNRNKKCQIIAGLEMHQATYYQKDLLRSDVLLGRQPLQRYLYID